MNVFQEERHRSSGPQGMCRDFVGGEVQSLTNVGSCGAEGICESRAQDNFKFFSHMDGAEGGVERGSLISKVCNPGEDTADGAGTGVARYAMANGFAPHGIFMIVECK